MATENDYSSVTIDGKYLVKDLVGTGSMSSVYRGKETGTGKTVAVKIMKASHIGDPEIVTRFVREVRTCMSLKHKHIVKVFAGGRLPTGEPYLIMEFLHGSSLGEILEAQKILPSARCLKLISQAADALEEAHNRGYVHRDIKPQNLMAVTNIFKQETMKVLDFGVAKMTGWQSLDQFTTAPGNVLGTPLYMSPEQVLGSALDGRSDIYALGCVLYQCLCGTPAIPGSSALDVMKNHLDFKPKHLNENGKTKYPDELNALVQKSMAKKPADRYQSMAEFSYAIREFSTPPLLFKLMSILNLNESSKKVSEVAYYTRTKSQKKRD